MDLRILKELQVDFSDLRILKELGAQESAGEWAT